MPIEVEYWWTVISHQKTQVCSTEVLSTEVLSTSTTETLRTTETAQTWYTDATYSVTLWVPYVSTI